LVSGVADVDDGEARHAERNVLVFEHAAIVRATMMHGADHRAHLATRLTPNSADATHKDLTLPQKSTKCLFCAFCAFLRLN